MLSIGRLFRRRASRRRLSATEERLRLFLLIGRRWVDASQMGWRDLARWGSPNSHSLEPSPYVNWFYRVLLGFTRFYWVLRGFIGFYWVLMGFTLVVGGAEQLGVPFCWAEGGGDGAFIKWQTRTSFDWQSVRLSSCRSTAHSSNNNSAVLDRSTVRKICPCWLGLVLLQ